MSGAIRERGPFDEEEEEIPPNSKGCNGEKIKR
jgi:hypothetical protein